MSSSFVYSKHNLLSKQKQQLPKTKQKQNKTISFLSLANDAIPPWHYRGMHILLMSGGVSTDITLPPPPHQQDDNNTIKQTKNEKNSIKKR